MRLEEEARQRAKAARPEYERMKATFDAKRGRRGGPPNEPDDESPPDRQINLTDLDSKRMRRSDAHEYRQSAAGHHLVERDIFLRFDRAHKEGFMSVQPRTTWLTLTARRSFAGFTFTSKPPDHCRNADPGPSCH